MSDDSDQPGLFDQLKRRNVFRVVGLYAVVAWVLIQIGEATFEPLGLPQGSQRLLIILAGLGFPVAVVLAWIFEVTPEGIVRATDSSAAKVAHLHTGRRIDFAIIGTLLLVVGLMLWGPELNPLPDEAPAAAPDSALAGPTLPVTPPFTDEPSIAVLPFTNMSGDPEQEYFSDGITEDIITDLAKLSGLSVIARNSTFVYKGQAVDIGEVGRKLGVGYVLEGSVRKNRDRVRVTAQLVNAISAHHVWAERWDRPLGDIFAVQDEITNKIVSTLDVQITLAEQGIVTRRRTKSLEAYDAFLRGASFYFQYTPEANLQARRMLERAIELDPEFAGAYSLLGFTYEREWRRRWAQDPQALERAFELAEKALGLDDSLGVAHALLGMLHLYQRKLDRAVEEVARAASLDPNNVDVRIVQSLILSSSGRPEEAIASMEKAMKLDPHYPADWLIVLGVSNYSAGRQDAAIGTLERALSRVPNYPSAHAWLAAVYSELGRGDEARAEVAAELRANPDFSLEGWKRALPFMDRAVLDRSFEALRQAGAPESPRSQG